MTFIETCQQLNVTKESHFHELAQIAIESYYLIPYPGKKDIKPQINRPRHGGLHVSSAALNLEMFIELYQKYAPGDLNELKTQDGSSLNPETIKLLKLAAIYHDSANINEVEGDEKAHGENFKRDMLSLGFTLDVIAPIALAIEKKDGEAGKNNKPSEIKETKNIYQKLIHDADCLDIIRVVAEGNFDREYLDIFNDLSQFPDFLKELDEIIENHLETLKSFEGDGAVGNLHSECEYSSNCYLSVVEAEKNMLLQTILFACLREGKNVAFSDIDISSLSLLDLYNRKNSLKVQRIVAEMNPLLKDTSEQQLGMKLYQKDGCYVRALKSTVFDDELKVLKENQRVLNQCGIHSTRELKQFFEQQYDNDKVWAPKGFKWRPCSFLMKEVATELFGSDLLVIINPHHQGTLVPYLYKKNVMSHSAADGVFQYDAKTGFNKDKKDIKGIREKMIEMETRRKGISADLIPDKGLHYWGKSALSHNEALGTYEKEGIVGIIVGNTEKSAKDALLLQSKLGYPLREFYRYSPEKGLNITSTTEVLAQACITTHGVYISEIESRIKQLRLPPNAISIQTTTYKKDIQEWNNLTMPVVDFTIHCNYTGLDQETIKKIQFILNNLLKLKPINLNYADFVLDVIVSNTDKGMKVFIHSFDEGSRFRDKFVKAILDDLEKILSDSILLEDIVLGNQLVNELKTKTIKNIKLAGLDPYQYTFTHPGHDKIKCRAWVREGRSEIEFSLENEKKITRLIDFLPAINKQYFQERIEVLNRVVNDELIKSELKRTGIESLHFSLVTSGGKEKLIIKFVSNDPQGMNVINKMLSITDIAKYRVTNENEIAITFTPKNIQKLLEYFTESNFQFSAPKIIQKRHCFFTNGSKKEEDSFIDSANLTL
ncbi:hypothetical protein Lsai_2152 [Legionella sainthelensi]|uniref:SidE PDE domain-containing protein n=1 Tax=Legionella sainthelensi TaxID=28087 RepID=A0A0W0YHH3_9GAMM|nr:hypothetical protein [Legionella sainthelensi]KTD56022.1 hypothetical protein Lsai_2152 [Legionella sainthelensi]VEH36946.1 Uncharacterised protein [Legionella sainthelensi]